MKILRPVLLLAIGLFIIYWSLEHSPESLGKMITNELTGSYTLSEPMYYISLVVGSIIGLLGLVSLLKSFK